MSQTVKNYLLLFAQEFVDFRFAEIESIIKIFNISLKLPNVEPKNRPYWIIESCESDIKKIASRSVSLKFVAELYCSGKTLDEFHENARNYVQFINKEYSKQSFKFIVETYNLHLKLAQKIEKIESMNYLDSALGPIDLINPDNTMIYFEYHGLKNNEPKLEEIIFGKWIADGRRDLISKISLKNRKYIGNTSMDAQLSLLMANQGLCKENDLMLDCFCGTGSLLVSCALFGSYVFGFDIDYLTLHAQSKPVRAFMKTRDKDESVKANLEQYNLQDKYIDVFVGDFSNCSLHERVVFDSIICDPPYGVREAMSKIEKKERRMKFTAMTEDAIHYPSLSSYDINNLYNDLLNFAACRLKMNGRLVMWFPIADHLIEENIFPEHTALQLVSKSRQQLISETSRILLTYEKISDHGEIVIKEHNYDFREKYFMQNLDKETKQELRDATAKRNNEEAAKRGNKIYSREEWREYHKRKRNERN